MILSPFQAVRVILVKFNNNSEMNQWRNHSSRSSLFGRRIHFKIGAVLIICK